MNIHPYAAQIATDALRALEVEAGKRLPVEEYANFERIITQAVYSVLDKFYDYSDLQRAVMDAQNELEDAQNALKEAESEVSDLEEKLENAEKEAESRISELEKKLEKAEKALNTLIWVGEV
jgi:predicted nuclease with TOPRIM domain